MSEHFDNKIFPLVLITLVASLTFAAVGLAQQNLSTFTCNPVQVSSYKTYTVGTTTYTGRVWVLCNPPLSSTQQYFAVPLTEAAEAARFLSLFTAAFVAGKALEIRASVRRRKKIARSWPAFLRLSASLVESDLKSTNQE